MNPTRYGRNGFWEIHNVVEQNRSCSIMFPKTIGLSKLNQFHNLHILNNSLKSLGHKHTQTNLRCLFYIESMHVNSKMYILHQPSQIGQCNNNRLC